MSEPSAEGDAIKPALILYAQASRGMRDLDPYAWLYRVAVMIKNSKALADIALHGSIDLSAWLPEKSSDRGRFPIRGRTYPAALLTGMQTFAFFAGNLRAKPSVSRVWPLAQAR